VQPKSQAVQLGLAFFHTAILPLYRQDILSCAVMRQASV